MTAGNGDRPHDPDPGKRRRRRPAHPVHRAHRATGRGKEGHRRRYQGRLSGGKGQWI